MKKNIGTKIVTICLAIIMAFAPTSASAALLRTGSRGTEVKSVQSTLKKMGYFTYPNVTGYFGVYTTKAVKSFQKANGLKVDGIVGPKTQSVLLKKSTGSTGVKVTTVSSVSSNKIGDLDWFKKVQYIWKRGMKATVIDVKTGKSFQMKRTYGTNHADCEPLTKSDTNIIKSIWGGLTWERRAVVVKVDGYVLAGSMTSMAHAGVDSKKAGIVVSGRSCGYGTGVNLDAVKNNGVNGVMDIHFKNSRTHTTNVVQKIQQDMVAKAADYIHKVWA